MYHRPCTRRRHSHTSIDQTKDHHRLALFQIRTGAIDENDVNNASFVHLFIFLFCTMIPSVLIEIIVGAVLLLSTHPAAVSSTSIVIEVKGDCASTGERVAHEHGYRYVRQVGWPLITRLTSGERDPFRFSMAFVKSKRIRCRSIITDIDELLNRALILHVCCSIIDM